MRVTAFIRQIVLMWVKGHHGDTWATVGSCAQIGKTSILSGGVALVAF